MTEDIRAALIASGIIGESWGIFLAKPLLIHNFCIITNKLHPTPHFTAAAPNPVFPGVSVAQQRSKIAMAWMSRHQDHLVPLHRMPEASKRMTAWQMPWDVFLFLGPLKVSGISRFFLLILLFPSVTLCLIMPPL